MQKPWFLLACLALARCGSGFAYACPLFDEFFSDPVDVSDAEGEFVEIRLWTDESEKAYYAPGAVSDSLYIQFEEKAPLGMLFPQGDRLLLVHDSASCKIDEPLLDSAGFSTGYAVSCGVLPVSLPNSRETVWRLWAGNCRDSVNLPQPKSGKSLQRVNDSDDWIVAEPTKGLPPGAAEFQYDGPYLRLSEIHHCPQEPEPEWVEVYNMSDRTLPLSKFRFCERGGQWTGSIAAYESVILTKDTLLLREYLGYRDVRLVQVSMGFLNNTAGSLSICLGDSVVDSVAWDKNTVACPAGFSPLTGRAENTPGFQGNRSQGGDAGDLAPFTYKISSRVVRKGKTPLRVFIETETAVQLRLLDSAGHEEWKMTVPAPSSSWWLVPLDGLPKLGVAYVSLSAGKYEKLVGILLRP